MIVFDRLWQTMKEKNIATYTLREKYDFYTDTISNLRNNQIIKTNTLSELCEILDGQLEDIAEHKKD